MYEVKIIGIRLGNLGLRETMTMIPAETGRLLFFSPRARMRWRTQALVATQLGMMIGWLPFVIGFGFSLRHGQPVLYMAC